MRGLCLLLLALLLRLPLWAQETCYVVDRQGGGDFTSIQACLDALPSKPQEWRVVVIRPGEYREKITLDVYKDKVLLLGECDKAGNRPRIVWDDHTGRVVNGHEMTTYDTWTCSIQADDVWLKNLEIENDAPLGSGQAVALETRGDRIRIDQCRLVGNQDTFFTKGYVSRVYVTRTYIEGTTDFIFGPSIVLFEECDLLAKANSYVTAASTTERNLYGYIFRKCSLRATPEVEWLLLGRPWKSTARTVWIECLLDAPILPEGWRDWHDSARKGAVYYAEYGCTGRGADRTGRVAWSKELTPEEVAAYTPERIFYKKTGSEQFYDSWLPDEQWLGACAKYLN
ncbi:MAG: pectin methylesterase [Alistipes sp.]|nr:pectin methylesterase [Alistipes sp.]